jgi:hypothetical protein
MPADCCKERWERLMHEDPDMPVFTLLAKDIIAIEVVEFWLRRAIELRVNPAKISRVQEHLKWLIEFKRDNPHRMQIPD